MEVIEFRFLNRNDPHQSKYEAWSRVYEYPYMLRRLKELGATQNSIIHNTCWGFDGVHLRFKNDMDAEYKYVLHTDILHSDLPNTAIYDIRYPAPQGFNNAFDFVINISTIEEVRHNNIDVIKNLFRQVKVGGYFIMTFDYCPRLADYHGEGSINLNVVSEFINKNIEGTDQNIISGINSALPCPLYPHLNCGVLVIRKTADI